MCFKTAGHALLQTANKTVIASMGSISIRKLTVLIASFMLPYALLS